MIPDGQAEDFAEIVGLSHRHAKQVMEENLQIGDVVDREAKKRYVRQLSLRAGRMNVCVRL